MKYREDQYNINNKTQVDELTYDQKYIILNQLKKAFGHIFKNDKNKNLLENLNLNTVNDLLS